MRVNHKVSLNLQKHTNGADDSQEPTRTRQAAGVEIVGEFELHTRVTEKDVESVGHYLDQLSCDAEDSPTPSRPEDEKNSWRLFWSNESKPPSITATDYVKRLFNRLRWPSPSSREGLDGLPPRRDGEAIVVALIYVERLVVKFGIKAVASRHAIHRTILAAWIVASKWRYRAGEDLQHKHYKHYVARVLHTHYSEHIMMQYAKIGGVKPSEVERLEEFLLSVVELRTHVSLEEFEWRLERLRNEEMMRCLRRSHPASGNSETGEEVHRHPIEEEEYIAERGKEQEDSLAINLYHLVQNPDVLQELLAQRRGPSFCSTHAPSCCSSSSSSPSSPSSSTSSLLQEEAM